MFKLKILVVLIITLITTSVFAQKGRVSGLVIDSESNDIVPFATVALLEASTSKVISGVISQDNGTFNLEGVVLGSYKVQISFIGYKTLTSTIIRLTKEQPNVNLGTIALKPQTESLNQVTVTAQGKTVASKIDRKVYRANDFASAKGGTATDLINKLPAITVDENGEISVRGTTDFLVYLNGKPTNIKPSVLLSQIQANTISEVDIISVPTARYDAQGKGGIINIKTKKNTNLGLSISANGIIGGAPWANLTDIYSKDRLKDDRYGAGFNITYAKKNYNLYGGVNYNKKNVNGKRSGEARVFVDQPNGDFFHMNASNGQRPEWYENFTANLGADFNLSDTKTLALSYFYGDRNEGRAAYYIYNTFFADANQSNKDLTTEQFLYNPNVDNRYGKYNTFSVDYNAKLQNKANFKTAVTFESSKLSRALNNQNFFYDTREAIDADIANNYANATRFDTYSLSDNTPLRALRWSADYEKKLDSVSSFGTGAQIQYTNIDGSFNFENTLVTRNLNNTIDLSRTIYAAYVDYTAKRGAFNYIVGLRAEYGDQTLENGNTNYVPIFGDDLLATYKQQKLDLFPSLHISYHLNKDNKITLAGSRRINRASVTKLAPFLYRRHFEVYVVGDPELEAEYLNNLELNYNQKIGKHSYTLTGFYRGTDNTVFRVNTVTSAVENPEINSILREDVLIRSFTNAGNSTSLGAEFNTNIIASSFAKFFIGASLYNFQIKGDVFGFDVDQRSTNWTLKANTNLKISKALKFNYNFSRQSRTVTSQGQNDAFSVSNIALTYKPTQRLDIALRGLDIFAQNDRGLDTNAFNEQGQQIFFQETLYERNGPVFEIGITYALNAKAKKKKAKDFQANKHFK